MVEQNVDDMCKALELQKVFLPHFTRDTSSVQAEMSFTSPSAI